MRLRFPALPRPGLKTLTYSLMHFAVAITVAYALTRSWHAALAIGMIEPLVQTVAYTLHERAWAGGAACQRSCPARDLTAAPRRRAFCPYLGG